MKHKKDIFSSIEMLFMTNNYHMNSKSVNLKGFYIEIDTLLSIIEFLLIFILRKIKSEHVIFYINSINFKRNFDLGDKVAKFQIEIKHLH